MEGIVFYDALCFYNLSLRRIAPSLYISSCFFFFFSLLRFTPQKMGERNNRTLAVKKSLRS